MKRGHDVTSADMDVRKFLIRVAAELGDALGDGLAGIYVHGSLATGTFVRHASDLDFLVLVDGPLGATRLHALEKALRDLDAARPVQGALEVTVLQQRHARNYEHPPKAELQFHSHPGLIAAQLMHARQHAVRLTGAPPQDAIGIVPWHAFMQSVMADFEANAALVERKPAAAVLNACRTLHDAMARQVSVLDKFAAAEWAQEHAPARFKPLIAAAAEAQGAGAAHSFDPREIEDFRRYVAGAAEPAFSKVRDTSDEDEEPV